MNTPAVARLRTPRAVRERCTALLDKVATGHSAHFEVRLERLDATARLISDETLRNYPDLDVPFHSRWRHFELDGVDLWRDYAGDHFDPGERAKRARAAIDLAVVSVLLDAGAGPHWRYQRGVDTTPLARSEGLAIASFDLLCNGTLSAIGSEPLRADASRLLEFDADTLAHGFQVSGSNPLAGLDGRAALLRALGAALTASPDVFGVASQRPGHLYDYFAAAGTGQVQASDILSTLLDTLSGIWPNGASLDGEPLGDVWPHDGIAANDATRGLLPLHKLSQWLSYSLIEPLQDAGLAVAGLDALTGLAEYRNGGLCLDAGLLVLRNPDVADEPLAVGEPLVVEWRALTVALLDRLLPLVRAHLRRPGLPLACMLQGGSWSAGRRLAAELRDDAGPPIRIRSDGTVF